MKLHSAPARGAPVCTDDDGRTLPWVIEDQGRAQFLVNKAVFVDPGLYRAEMARIFSHSWLYVGHESELRAAGDYLTRRVAGRPLIFCRNAAGTIQAFLNSCRHNGSLVCREERGNSAFFRCAYHGWVYRNSGELVEVPGEGAFGRWFERGENGLRAVPRLESYQGFVFVNFDAGAQPLREFLAGACEYLDLLMIQGAHGMEVMPGTHLYSTRANWKLLPVNVIDGSHFLPTHMSYLEYLRVRGTDLSRPLRDFQEAHIGNGHTVFEYEAPWGRPLAKSDPGWSAETNAAIATAREELCARLGPELGDRLARKNRNLVIFPNLIINDIVGITIRICEPIAPDYMETTAWQLAPRDEPEVLRKVRSDNFLTFLGPGGFATPDDIEAMEASQAGFAAWQEVPWATYSKGMDPGQTGESISGTDIMMRSYWQEWLRQMGLQSAGRAQPEQAA